MSWIPSITRQVLFTLALILTPLAVLTLIIVLVWDLPDYDQARASTIASIAVALATFLLAAVAFWQMRDARTQAQEIQHAQVRPLLIPASTIPKVAGPWLRPEDVWGSQLEHHLDIRNVGNGVAYDVWGILIPPENLAPFGQTYFTLILNLPIVSGEVANNAQFNKGGVTFKGEPKIQDVPLALPNDLAFKPGVVDQQRKLPLCLARLTLTCRDILGLRHAGIFDLTVQGDWIHVKMCTAARQDIRDLYEAQ